MAFGQLSGMEGQLESPPSPPLHGDFAHAHGDIWETIGNEYQRTNFGWRSAVRERLWLTACGDRDREKKKGPNTELWKPPLFKGLPEEKLQCNS